MYWDYMHSVFFMKIFESFNFILDTIKKLNIMVQITTVKLPKTMAF